MGTSPNSGRRVTLYSVRGKALTFSVRGQLLFLIRASRRHPVSRAKRQERKTLLGPGDEHKGKTRRIPTHQALKSLQPSAHYSTAPPYFLHISSNVAHGDYRAIASIILQLTGASRPLFPARGSFRCCCAQCFSLGPLCWPASPASTCRFFAVFDGPL